MGWTFSERWTRRELIAERTQNWNNKDRAEGNVYVVSECLKHCYRGNNFSGVLWTVWEHKEYDKVTGEILNTSRYIGCDLLKCVSYKGTREWGYKDMEESSGPNYYSCPLGYLDMVECPDNEYAPGWREKVRQYHADRKCPIKLKVDMQVKLKDGYTPQHFIITSLRPLRGVSIDDGRTYRLQRKAIEKELNLVGI